MKILLVTEFFPADLRLAFSGGVETRVYYLAKNLSIKNQVLVMCRRTSQLSQTKQDDNLMLLPCGRKTKFIEANFWSIFERFYFILCAVIIGLKLDFDIVEGSNYVTYLPAYLLGWLKRKPRIAWYADVLKGRWIGYFGLTGIFGEIIERLSLKLHWSKIIALSKVTKIKLIKSGIDAKKIAVVYGGVDTKLNIAAKSRSSFRQKKKKNIICISRLVKYKRVDDLINAFGLLINKFPYLTLIIVGQGPEEKNLKNLVKSKKLQARVIFLNNIPRNMLIKLLKQAYLFCLPSVVEGFGLVTIEAAAHGTPYIISDIGINKEITHNGKGGLFFKRQDIIDLCIKIEILLKDKNLYLKKQTEGLLLARNYNWRKVTQQTRKIYQEVVNE